MEKPIVFIGSSTEGLAVAETIRALLEEHTTVDLWNKNVFNLGESFLESLVNKLDNADFAILVLSDDDTGTSREKTSAIPRDNVLFELGLFMGRLGRKRSYYVYNTATGIKIPSDLTGIVSADYTHETGNDLQKSLEPACKKILTAIAAEGKRKDLLPVKIELFNKHYAFCKDISGYWWERILSKKNPSLISYMNIEYNEEKMMLEIKGDSYDADGQFIADWSSKTTSVNLNDSKLYYNWTGSFTEIDPEFMGIGEIQFDKKNYPFIGKGRFSNVSEADINNQTFNSFNLYKANAEEIKIMELNDRSRKAALVKKKISEL